MNRRDCIRFLLAATPAGLAAQTAAPPLILVLGDSMSAEYGIARGSGWVALLEKRLAREHIAARVLNASVSGDTTAGGRVRLPALNDALPVMNMLMAKNESAGRRAWMEANGALIDAEI